MKIDKFFGEYRYLSNFHVAKFTWKDKEWMSTEHAYQAMKATTEAEREYIRNLPVPRDAKKEGSKIKLRRDWEMVKDAIMEEVVFEKFNQNYDIKKLLLDTGDTILEEGNTWGDKYWGICPPNSGDGQNKLGIILMTTREKLRG